MNQDPYLFEEANNLAELVALTAEAWPKSAPRMSSIRRRVLGSMESKINSVQRELHLGSLGREFRSAILGFAGDQSSAYFRSPEHGISPITPSGRIDDYTYERSSAASSIEGELHSYTCSGAMKHGCEHVIFGSGMGAIAGTLQSLIAILSPTDYTPLRIGNWGSYFETSMVLKYLSGSNVQVSHLKGACVPDGIDGRDILIVEPVRYNWDLDSLSVSSFLAAWREAKRPPRVLIIDTTLCWFAWKIDELIRGLEGTSPVLVLVIRSGLKLDQQGLELVNVGVVDIYSFGESREIPGAAQFAEYLRVARGMTGAGVSLFGRSILELPWVLQANYSGKHAGAVFENNAEVANTVVRGGLFTDVVHPSLKRSSNQVNVAPFVVLRLEDESHQNLTRVIRAIASRLVLRGGGASVGSSFGFRGHRYEAIIPNKRQGLGILKLAIGSRKGPALNNIIEAVNEVAAMSSGRLREFDA